jgi:hypothetical protein
MMTWLACPLAALLKILTRIERSQHRDMRVKTLEAEDQLVYTGDHLSYLDARRLRVLIIEIQDSEPQLLICAKFDFPGCCSFGWTASCGLTALKLI